MGDAFERQFGCELLVTSGTRTHQEQIDIFLSAYRAQESGGGPFGDVRWWNGVRYVRYDPSGTVAQPGTSLHESDRALDLRDSGADAGVASGGNARADWLRHNCGRWGFAANGYGFGEPWHYEYQGDPWDVPEWAAGKVPAPTPRVFEEDDMKLIRWNGQHVFGIGKGAVFYADHPDRLPGLVDLYGPWVEVDNAKLTNLILGNGLYWDAFDAVLRGTAPGSEGRYWDREMAEGIAIRGAQERAQKTLGDVLATAQQIAPRA